MHDFGALHTMGTPSYVAYLHVRAKEDIAPGTAVEIVEALDTIAIVQKATEDPAFRMAGVADERLRANEDGVIAISGMVSITVKDAEKKRLLHDHITMNDILSIEESDSAKIEDAKRKVVGTFVRAQTPEYREGDGFVQHQIRIMLCPWLFARPVDDLLTAIRNNIGDLATNSTATSARTKPQGWSDAKQRILAVVQDYL